jgi:hypothetical protein
MLSTEVPTDHFPSTHATWVAEHVTLSADPDARPALARAPRDELNAHVMQRYFASRRTYVQGSGWRGLPRHFVAGVAAEAIEAETDRLVAMLLG